MSLYRSMKHCPITRSIENLFSLIKLIKLKCGILVIIILFQGGIVHKRCISSPRDNANVIPLLKDCCRCKI